MSSDSFCLITSHMIFYCKGFLLRLVLYSWKRALQPQYGGATHSGSYAGSLHPVHSSIGAGKGWPLITTFDSDTNTIASCSWHDDPLFECSVLLPWQWVSWWVVHGVNEAGYQYKRKPDMFRKHYCDIRYTGITQAML